MNRMYLNNEKDHPQTMIHGWVGGHRHAQMLQIRPKWKAAKVKEIVQYE